MDWAHFIFSTCLLVLSSSFANQAINHNSTGARLMMSRVLWLLSLDDEKSTLGRTLETYGRTLPEWVWIPWIPQLLTSLTRR